MKIIWKMRFDAIMYLKLLLCDFTLFNQSTNQQINLFTDMDFRFVADRSLGKLAKWLRILGFDTRYESGALSRLLFENQESERIFLTRTEKFREMSGEQRIVFIKSNYPVDQLKQVINDVGITHEDLRPFSMCTPCNSPIEVIHKDSVAGRVPDYIWETHDAFRRCPQCERIYWSGSHTKRSMERIQTLFAKVHNK